MQRTVARIYMVIVGIASYCFLLFLLQLVFSLELDLTTIFVTTLVAVVVGILFYKFRGLLHAIAGKHSGRYSLEDLSLLEDTTDRVAVSMEKEYLWEQLREREEELSLLNRLSAITTSSVDTHGQARGTL